MQFHRAIADAARNPFLIQTLEYLGQFLHGATQVTRANEARRMDFAAEVQTEHQAILHAVQAGDVEAARHAAAAHMGNAIRRIQGAARFLAARRRASGATLGQGFTTLTATNLYSHRQRPFTRHNPRHPMIKTFLLLLGFCWGASTATSVMTS